MKYPYDKTVLLSVGDGPDGIEIYTSEDQGIVDWAPDIPALYINVSLNDAAVQLGPFSLSKSLIAQLKSRLKEPEVNDTPKVPTV